MNYALIRQNKVENIIVADAQFVASLTEYDSIVNLDTLDIPVGIGWDYIDGQFSTTPLEVVDEQPITTISMRQLRLGLLKLGALSKVPAIISSSDSPLKEELEIEWAYAQTVHRNGFIQHITQKLKLDIDELFNLAATL